MSIQTKPAPQAEVFRRLVELTDLADRDHQILCRRETNPELERFLNGGAVLCAIRRGGVMHTCVTTKGPGTEFWFSAYGA